LLTAANEKTQTRILSLTHIYYLYAIVSGAFYSFLSFAALLLLLRFVLHSCGEEN